MSKDYGLYGTISVIAREFNVDRKTVYARVRDIQKGIDNGRYNKYAVCGTLINKAAFLDATKYHKQLDDLFQCQFVPDFNPYECAEMLALKGAVRQCELDAYAQKCLG